MEFEKYVGNTVILTDWQNNTSEHFIIKNDIEKRRLEILFGKDTHYLTYNNIGQERAVVKIELKKK